MSQAKYFFSSPCLHSKTEDDKRSFGVIVSQINQLSPGHLPLAIFHIKMQNVISRLPLRILFLLAVSITFAIAQQQQDPRTINGGT